ncbi:MAG: DUF7331 family protein [Natronomonas sp.]
MPDSDAKTERDSAGANAHLEPGVVDAVARTEFYESDDGVVFYDAENPLAWIQADSTLLLPETA